MKVKVGQTWVHKKDGRLLFVGKRHDSIRWNCTDSLTKRSHSMPDYEIIERYKLLDSEEAERINAEIKDVRQAAPVVFAETERVIIRQRPRWMPKFIHKAIVDWVIIDKSKKVYLKNE